MCNSDLFFFDRAGFEDSLEFLNPIRELRYGDAEVFRLPRCSLKLYHLVAVFILYYSCAAACEVGSGGEAVCVHGSGLGAFRHFIVS